MSTIDDRIELGRRLTAVFTYPDHFKPDIATSLGAEGLELLKSAEALHRLVCTKIAE